MVIPLILHGNKRIIVCFIAQMQFVSWLKRINRLVTANLTNYFHITAPFHEPANRYLE